MELFNKQVSDQDQNGLDLDYVTSQCNYLPDQEAMNAVDTSNFSSSNVLNMINGENQEVIKTFLSGHGNDQQKDQSNHFHPSVSQLENLNLPYDHHQVDQIRLSTSQMQFNFSEENKGKGDVLWSDNGILEDNLRVQFEESPFVSQEQQGNDKNCMKHENGRSDSMSNCSDDQFDDEDEDDDTGKYRSSGMAGKGPPAKNLAAERRRRKKLNDRLYSLRALVPKISKLDKASILVDAIAFVKELQTQAKELQDELEERSDDEGPIKPDQHSFNELHHVGAKQNQNPQLISNDKGPQMEVQVQVAQIDAREFFVKVFCEQKPGGFVRLLEALDSLGLEVINANVTSFRSLVSNVLKVEKKDNEMVQADYVRESLLELTRHPPSGWSTEMARPQDNYHHQMHNGYINNSNHHLFHHIHDE